MKAEKTRKENWWLLRCCCANKSAPELLADTAEEIVTDPHTHDPHTESPVAQIATHAYPPPFKARGGYESTASTTNPASASAPSPVLGARALNNVPSTALVFPPSRETPRLPPFKETRLPPFKETRLPPASQSRVSSSRLVGRYLGPERVVGVHLVGSHTVSVETGPGVLVNSVLGERLNPQVPRYPSVSSRLRAETTDSSSYTESSAREETFETLLVVDEEHIDQHTETRLRRAPRAQKTVVYVQRKMPDGTKRMEKWLDLPPQS